jgi:hypothetical protein
MHLKESNGVFGVGDKQNCPGAAVLRAIHAVSLQDRGEAYRKSSMQGRRSRQGVKDGSPKSTGPGFIHTGH